MLNIGLIRDSALTETNDVRFFAEVFEAAAVIAAEVFKLELTLCGDGTRAPAGTPRDLRRDDLSNGQLGRGTGG